MSGCEQEMCEFWNGETCVCAAMLGDPEAIDDLEHWTTSLEDE